MGAEVQPVFCPSGAPLYTVFGMLFLCTVFSNIFELFLENFREAYKIQQDSVQSIVSDWKGRGHSES